MQALSCCSSTAHPCAVYPDEAQQPIKSSASLRCQVSIHATSHTQYRCHDSNARICVCCIWLSYSQFWEWWKLRRYSLCDGLRIPDDHIGRFMCCDISTALSMQNIKCAWRHFDPKSSCHVPTPSPRKSESSARWLADSLV